MYILIFIYYNPKSLITLLYILFNIKLLSHLYATIGETSVNLIKFNLYIKSVNYEKFFLNAYLINESIYTSYIHFLCIIKLVL